MVDSEWLDIAISVALVWFVFAIAVSAVNEGLTRILALRSKQLWKALGQMLDGSDKPTGLVGNLLDLFAWHGRPMDPQDDASVTARLYGTDTVQSVETRTGADKRTRIHFIPSQLFSQALVEAATKDAADVKQAIDDFISSDAPDSLRRQLRVLWASAGQDVSRFRHEVEDWFDGQMARLSVIYKQQVRIVLGVFGVVLAVVGFGFGLRTDAFGLVRDLQHDADFRTVVTSAGTSAASTDLANAGCRPSNTTTTSTMNVDAEQSTTECEIRGLALLKGIDVSLHGGGPKRTASVLGRFEYLYHPGALVGVLVTGVAISFGSTFWYSVLQRLVGLRGGGKTTAAT